MEVLEYNLTILTVFSASIKDVPMGCRNAALYEPPMKNCTINSLLYVENKRQALDVNWCPFYAFSLNLHINQRLPEENSKLYISFRNILDILSPNQLEGSTPTIFQLMRICLHSMFSFTT